MIMASRFIPNLPFLVTTFVHVTWYQFSLARFLSPKVVFHSKP